MIKQALMAVVIGSFVFSSSTFAATNNQVSNNQAFLSAWHSPKLSSLSKDDDYKWLMSVLLIGKKVEIPSIMSPLYTDKGLTGAVLITQAATLISVKITDDHGAVIQNLELGSAPVPALQDFSWDGKTFDGKVAAPGIYRISAYAMIDGNYVAMATAGDFNVKSVSVDREGAIVLNLDAVGAIHLDDVLKVL